MISNQYMILSVFSQKFTAFGDKSQVGEPSACSSAVKSKKRFQILGSLFVLWQKIKNLQLDFSSKNTQFQSCACSLRSCSSSSSLPIITAWNVPISIAMAAIPIPVREQIESISFDFDLVNWNQPFPTTQKQVRLLKDWRKPQKHLNVPVPPSQSQVCAAHGEG